MAEYKNGVNAFGNMTVSKEDRSSEVHTGRAVFVDEDKYSEDPDYKLKVDKCLAEGFHSVGDSGSGGGGGTEPLILRPTEFDDSRDGYRLVMLNKTEDEVYEALDSGTPCYVGFDASDTSYIAAASTISDLGLVMNPLIDAEHFIVADTEDGVAVRRLQKGKQDGTLALIIQTGTNN